MNDAKNRGRSRELDAQLSFAETEPMPPEQLRDALRILATWVSRGPRGRAARGEQLSRN